MGLFTPGWQNKNESLAVAWIRRQKGNSRELVKAVLGSSNQKVRQAALEQISDSSLLAEIYDHKDLRDIDLKRAAMRSITDQSVLARYAKQCDENALAGLTDPGILFQAATDPGFYTSDHARTASAAAQQAGRQNRFAGLAAKKIRDPNMMYRIVRDSRFQDAVDEAISQITDREMLRSIAMDPKFNPRARARVLYLLNDDELKSLLEKGKEPIIWRSIVEKVRDPVFRKEYCEKAELHEWELISSDHKDVGDTRSITEVYRCRFCGKERVKHDSYKF